MWSATTVETLSWCGEDRRSFSRFHKKIGERMRSRQVNVQSWRRVTPELRAWTEIARRCFGSKLHVTSQRLLHIWLVLPSPSRCSDALSIVRSCNVRSLSSILLVPHYLTLDPTFSCCSDATCPCSMSSAMVARCDLYFSPNHWQRIMAAMNFRVTRKW